MTVKRQHAGIQILISLSVATVLGGCAVSPWDNAPPASSTYRTTGGAAASGVPAGFYRVNPGDTLQSIAGAFGQRTQEVAIWNGLSVGSPVAPGQVLRVAPPAFAQNATVPAPTPAPVAPVIPAPNPSATPSGPVQGVLAWPLRGPIIKPFVAGKSKGIVIGGRPDEPVKAAAAGRVVYAGTGIEAYGPLVIIKHDDTLITAYGQNGKLLVQEGDAVAQGQPIGTVGADPSGVPSIQFEVRKEGHPVDPQAWLPR